MTKRLNLTETRKHSLFSDYGIKDYYNFYKRGGGMLSPVEYNKVFRDIIYEICNIIIEQNYNYKLSSRLGVITIVRYKCKIHKNKNGKLVIPLAIDFKSTLDLWEGDEEARKNKQVIRYENEHTNGFIYRIRYRKGTAKYKNKTIYFLKFNRGFKNRLSAFLMDNGPIEKDTL